MEQSNESPRFSLPSPVLQAIERLNAAGHEAYAVGGAVRDLLRGVAPHDYDITTSATPDEMKVVFSAFRTVETGIAHGTLTVLIEGFPIEITTFRVDGDYTDSRHPDSVTFTRSLREDAARRDFTVNAMAYHPKEGVRDFFGGQEDLLAGVLRTVGDAERRFTEDALRILRALRFSATLGYRIEEETATAIHALAPTLSHVAAERIREELVKLITAPDAVRVLREYADTVAVFLPEILPAVGFNQKNPHHDIDVYEHTLRALAAAPPDPVIRLAVLFHDLGKPACYALDETGVGHFYGHAEESTKIADAALRRLRFDNETRERVLLLVRMHDTVPMPETRQFSRIRSRHGDLFLKDWLTVIRADRTGQKETLAPQADVALRAAEAAAEALLRKEERMSLATLALRGEDVIALGYKGKEIGDALRTALDAVIDGKAPNEREELIMLLKESKATPPIECERKFLIRYPDTAALLAMGAEKSDITQTYLNAPEGVTVRVRKRVYADKTVYFYTKKTRLTSLSAIEEEKEIDEAEYLSLLTDADEARRPVHKTRYTLPYAGHLLEIDVYPFWQRQAVFEVELTCEEEEIAFPDFLQILREVTADRAYKNVSLAKSIPPEEA